MYVAAAGLYVMVENPIQMDRVGSHHHYVCSSSRSLCDGREPSIAGQTGFPPSLPMYVAAAGLCYGREPSIAGQTGFPPSLPMYVAAAGLYVMVENPI